MCKPAVITLGDHKRSDIEVSQQTNIQSHNRQNLKDSVMVVVIVNKFSDLH